MAGDISQRFEPATFSGDGLACRRGGRTVFADLSFTLTGGGALVLRGSNGSGKTTLMRLMAGLGRATAGRLAWNDTDVAEDPESHSRRVRYAGHLDGIKPNFSVRENTAFWADLWNAPNQDVDAALAAFGLGHLSHVPARVLSAGQRHRVALARLLLGRAPLWLLDEPTNTLDDAALTALAAAITQHRRAGGMAVIASHGESLITDATFLTLNDFPARSDEAAA